VYQHEHWPGGSHIAAQSPARLDEGVIWGRAVIASGDDLVIVAASEWRIRLRSHVLAAFVVALTVAVVVASVLAAARSSSAFHRLREATRASDLVLAPESGQAVEFASALPSVRSAPGVDAASLTAELFVRPATLRALGITRAGVGSLLGLHVLTLVAIALGLGIPAGLVAGRLAWTPIANSAHVVVLAVWPSGSVAWVVGVALVAAVLAVGGPIRRVLRFPPAALLHAE
jgi:hypothetical protein